MKVPLASSRHLSVFAIDVDHHLAQTGLFSKIIIKKTGLPKCALNIVCSLADGSIPQTKVTTALKQVWKTAPLEYYGGKNSYKIVTSIKKVQMQFATSTEGEIVTGCIDVIGFH